MLRTVNHFSLHRINSTELRVVSDVSEGVLPVIVAEDPLTCVVRGSGMALERMDKLGSIFSYE